MTPVWVLLQEGCEIRGRDAFVGIFPSVDAATDFVQKSEDADAYENDRPAELVVWDDDAGTLRWGPSSNYHEFFLMERTLTFDGAVQ